MTVVYKILFVIIIWLLQLILLLALFIQTDNVLSALAALTVIVAPIAIERGFKLLSG